MEKEKLRDFYMSKYPTDSYGENIDPDADFEGLFETLDHYGDVYEYIGVGDSMIREALFSRLAEIMGCGYEVVYEQWLAA
ncbi:MAG: hypothetical protein J6N19_00200 [Clostridium sp.]|nr:hypothetical protein [Clostridium sp.]